MAKHKYIETPEKLMEAWKGYKENLTEQNKDWLQIQYVGRNGERKADPLKVPMTFEGFKRYCRENLSEVHHYFSNPDGAYDDYRNVCSHIKDEIRECQIVGGLLGVYNPSITQRLNGLTEKQDIDLKTQVSPFTPFNLDVPEDNGSS